MFDFYTCFGKERKEENEIFYCKNKEFPYHKFHKHVSVN